MKHKKCTKLYWGITYISAWTLALCGFFFNWLVFLHPASQGHRRLCDSEGCEGASSSGQLPGQRHQQQWERGHRAPQAVGPPQEHVAAPWTHPLWIRREIPVRESREEEQVEEEVEEEWGIEVFNPPKPQTCKNPQGLGSIFNSGKSSTATPASFRLLIYSSSSPSTITPLPGPPSTFSWSLALTKPDTPQDGGTQLNLCPALHFPSGTHGRVNVDQGGGKRHMLAESNKGLGMGWNL